VAPARGGGALYTAPVQAAPDTSRSIRPAGIPGGVRKIIDSLTTRGHAAYLVGGCVRDLLRGKRVGDFDVATSAAAETVLELLPRAIPIGLRHGTVMVPTPDGPVDVTSFRAGPDIEADLARRDFTINAMAYDISSEALLDPFGGQSDLAARRLRAVGSAADRFGEDPLRALRAARLAATLKLEVTPEIESEMAKARAGLRGVARERVRRELALMLLAPDAARGLALLRRTGIEADLAPGAPRDAVSVVGALPEDLELRLAGWLRRTPAEAILRRLRFPRRSVQRVVRLLRHHPIGASVNPKRDAAVRKLIRRLGPEDLEALFALRETELAARDGAEPPAAELEQLSSIRAAIARARRAGALALRRSDLALSGQDVMALLGCGPGRVVGQALRHLTDQVVEDPSLNTPEQLRALLARWATERSDV
jgi:tRNA nucleotidyltransferase (CCA-adding enzyme)